MHLENVLRGDGFYLGNCGGQSQGLRTLCAPPQMSPRSCNENLEAILDVAARFIDARPLWSCTSGDLEISITATINPVNVHWAIELAVNPVSGVFINVLARLAWSQWSFPYFLPLARARALI